MSRDVNKQDLDCKIGVPTNNIPASTMLSDSLKTTATSLFTKHFGGEPNLSVIAPGRVNLIGEHTDYTGGFVFPLAIDYSTVIVGQGTILTDTLESKIQLVSALKPEELEVKTLGRDATPPAEGDSHWTWYVLGVVAQYFDDLPSNASFDLKMAIAGNVPLGGGLSSSASLEIATARLLEEVSKKSQSAKVRAIRCQKAENVWCHSPCGIMDQYISSAGGLLLIDCTSLEFESVQMPEGSSVKLVVTNSNVKHDIAGGEYPIRVKQCKKATDGLKSVTPGINSLRDATLEDLEKAKPKMDEISYNRALHVIQENKRTCDAKEAVLSGDWKKLGTLMNDSHTSMKTLYEVSCTEIDVLVELAQNVQGVYGSRLTGGGFGGCTVTLVEKDAVANLMEVLTKEYKEKTGLECVCFETSPGAGARLLG